MLSVQFVIQWKSVLNKMVFFSEEKVSDVPLQQLNKYSKLETKASTAVSYFVLKQWQRIEMNDNTAASRSDLPWGLGKPVSVLATWMMLTVLLAGLCTLQADKTTRQQLS